MTISLTLNVQKIIEAETDEEYEAVRDEFIKILEEQGCTVDVTSEDEI